MILQEIEKQVHKWMESRSGELRERQQALEAEYRDAEKQLQKWMEAKNGEFREQQQALEAEYRERLSALQKEYQNRLNSIQAEYRAKQDELDQHNAQYVADAKAVQQQIQSSVRESERIISQGKNEIAGIANQQKGIQDACRQSLENQEQTLKKQEKDVKRSLADLQNDVDDLRTSQNAGRLLPLILSIVAIVLTLALGALSLLGLLPLNRDTDTEEEQKQTPTPTLTAPPTATPTPTPSPTPEPSPTPDPADAIPEVFPFLNGFGEAEEQLEVEAAECLRSYQMGGGLYANVFYGENLDENLFATLCASYNKLLIEATPEPTPDPTSDPTSDPTVTEAPAVPTATPDSTPGTTPGDGSSIGGDNGNDTSKEDVELTTTVLADIRGEGNYLCVFFVKQKEANSIRYDQTLSHINTALDVSSDEIASYLTVFPQDDELIGRYNAEKTLYPIQASLVPEDIAHRYDSLIEENGYRAVWLYDFEFERFVLYIVDPGAVDAAEVEAKMKEAKDIFDPSLVYMGAKEGRNYALIFPMTVNNDAWFELEPWYVNATQAYGLRPVQ